MSSSLLPMPTSTLLSYDGEDDEELALIEYLARLEAEERVREHSCEEY